SRRAEYWLNHLRIKLSVTQNAQRVALKLLSPAELRAQARQIAGAWAAALAAGRVTTPLVGLAALLANLAGARRWWPARRALRRDAKLSAAYLVARVTAAACPRRELTE